MADWAADVKKYAPNADDKVIAGIVRHCGIALQKADSSLVSFSDQAELDRVKKGFLTKKLALATEEEKDAALAATLIERFAALQQLLDLHREGDGFVLYTDLTDDEVKTLADAVNALSEPLAELTAAVVL